MEARSLQAAPAAHLEDLGHLIANLKADPKVARLVCGAEAARTALKARTDDWRGKYHVAMEMQRGLEHAEEKLHHLVRTSRDVILDDVRHSRRALKFQIYFPRGVRAVIRAPFQDQLVSVRTIAQQCAQDPSPKIREQAGILRAAADQMEVAYNHRHRALAAESASAGRLQEQKIQTVEACRRINNRLSELYPNQRDRVRSYFRRPRRRAGTVGEVAADSVQAVEAAPGPTHVAEGAVSPERAARTALSLVPAAATAPGLVPTAGTTPSPVGATGTA